MLVRVAGVASGTMSEPTVREMTADERERLVEELKRARANPVSVPQALAAAVSVLGAYLWKSLVLLVAILALAWTVLPGWIAAWMLKAAAGTALVAAGGIAMMVITANRSWMGFLARLHRSVEQDLADGRVRVRSYRPRAAITLKVDADAPLGHVLELDGGLLMFVPAALSRGAAGFPAERVELACAPASQVFVSARGEGGPLAAPERALAARALAPVVSKPCLPVPGTLESLPDSATSTAI